MVAGGISVLAQSAITTPSTPTSPLLSLETVTRASGELPRLHSLIVSRRGAIVLERYFNGRRASSLSNIKSASKSIVSALVGIAIDRHLLKDVREPVSSYFPDIFNTMDDRARRAITVEDLLSMRSG